MWVLLTFFLRGAGTDNPTRRRLYIPSKFFQSQNIRMSTDNHQTLPPNILIDISISNEMKIIRKSINSDKLLKLQVIPRCSRIHSETPSCRFGYEYSLKIGS